MLKNYLFIILNFIIPFSIICMEEEYPAENITNTEHSLDAQNLFNQLTALIKEKKEKQAIGILQENKTFWGPLFLTIADDDGNNLLHLACKNHCNILIKYLSKNDFPLWRKNNKEETIYGNNCDDKKCKLCVERLKILPTSISINHNRLTSPLRIIKPLEIIMKLGGNLDMQYEYLIFKLTQIGPDLIEQDSILSIISELIKANEFVKAKNLIRFGKSWHLTNILADAINKWKEDPKNEDIMKLIRFLINRYANTDFHNVDQIFRGYPDLKEEYEDMIYTRNERYSIPNLVLTKKKKSETYSTNNKIALLSGAAIIVGFIGYMLFKNHYQTINDSAVKVNLS